ncbi:MAG: DUF2079 domain-containing protein [Alteromonadaceae bacterium]|nr:DUF2079 domain-containing protein [Alteromonadaceae bacterium]
MCVFLTVYGVSIWYLKAAALDYGMANADIALYQNLLWNTNFDGLLFYSDFLFYEFGYRSYLTEHFSPTLTLLVPFYKLWSSPYLLLMSQTLAPVITALLVFIYAKKLNLPNTIGLLFAVAYCVHPTVVMATLDIGNGFHHDSLIPPFLIASLILFNSPHIKMYYLTLILTLGLKENVPFIVLIAGVVAFLTSEQRRKAAFSVVLAITFLIFALVIIPEVYNVKPQHASGIIERIAEQRLSISAFFSTLWANKELFWFASAFLSPIVLLTLAPEIAIYHYSSYETFIFDWHGLPSLTIVVISAMLGFKRWLTLTRHLKPGLATQIFICHLVVIVLAGVVYSSAKSRNLIFAAVLSERPAVTVSVESFKKMEEMLPKDERLGVQYAYWPYAANRKHLQLSEHAFHSEYFFVDTALLNIQHDAPMIRLINLLFDEGKIATLANEGARFFLFKIVDDFEHKPINDYLLPLNQEQFMEAKRTIAVKGKEINREGTTEF